MKDKESRLKINMYKQNDTILYRNGPISVWQLYISNLQHTSSVCITTSRVWQTPNIRMVPQIFQKIFFETQNNYSVLLFIILTEEKYSQKIVWLSNNKAYKTLYSSIINLIQDGVGL